jgi:predicted DCC family thiol-disulfide oxidoreductase YuxK
MAVKVAAPLFMLYDADCGLCSRTAQALRILDFGGRLRVVPLQRATVELGASAPPVSSLLATLHAGSPAEGWSTGGAAAMRIARAVPALRTLAWVGSLPGVRRLVEPGYRFIVAHRHQIGRLLGADRCRYRGDQDDALTPTS